MDRQKILWIFGAAWVSAALLTYLLYSSMKAPRVEKTVAIQAASHDMPAGTRLQKSDLKIVRVPEKDLPKAAITDMARLLDHPLLYPVQANEPITAAKIPSAGGAEGVAATIEPGKRAISVPISDTSGVSGLIQPRSHVDVLFTRPGSTADAVTTTILQDVTVLAIGRTTESNSAATPVPTTTATNQTAPRPTAATLLVTPEQTRVIELAKNQGRISLALRNPLDKSSAADNSATTSTALYNGFVPKDTRAAAAEKPPAPKVVEKVIEKKEPPKRVVDVFRGDKHVQETFAQ